MSEFVLDCSVTATWLIADEASAETDQLLEQLRNSFGFVPVWWHLEVGNLLVQAENLTTYDAAYLELAMRRQLPLATLDQGLARAAGRHGVTVLPH